MNGMVRLRFWPLVCATAACLDPLAPETDTSPPTPLDTLTHVTVTKVGDLRYVVHWNGAPIACPTSVKQTFPIPYLQERDPWYGEQLRAAGEGSLCDDQDPPEEVYRLSWIPSFDPTVIVRLERLSSGVHLSAVRLSGAGGYEPGVPVARARLDLAESEWRHWLHLVSSARFWTAPTAESHKVLDKDGNEVYGMGLDGAQWLLEARRGADYHAVDRWSPMRNGPYAAFRAASEWLLNRSGLVGDSLVVSY
ncbi:MAG: hypothetical protein P8X82_15900 [Gemmatimonadales bacterium]|jgi:hypothetical protein